MTIEEAFAPVTHRHPDCPVCNNQALIQDVPVARNDWDKLMVAIRSIDAKTRILLGKRIEVKEQ